MVVILSHVTKQSFEKITKEEVINRKEQQKHSDVYLIGNRFDVSLLCGFWTIHNSSYGYSTSYKTVA